MHRNLHNNLHNSHLLQLHRSKRHRHHHHRQSFASDSSSYLALNEHQFKSYRYLDLFIFNFLSSLIYFVFDPSESLYYYWLIVVSLAVLYNYLFIIGRASFELLQLYNPLLWIVLDYICDVIYLIDIFVRLRTGKEFFDSI